MIGGQVGDIIAGTFVFDSVTTDVPFAVVLVDANAPETQTGASTFPPLSETVVAAFPPETAFAIATYVPSGETIVSADSPETLLILATDVPVSETIVDANAPETVFVLVTEVPFSQTIVDANVPQTSAGSSTSVPITEIVIEGVAPETELLIEGVPDFYAERDGTTVTLTFRNREGRTIQVFKAPQENRSFSSLSFVTSDTDQDTVTGNPKYKARFVDRQDSVVVAAGQKSTEKYTTDG